MENWRLFSTVNQLLSGHFWDGRWILSDQSRPTSVDPLLVPDPPALFRLCVLCCSLAASRWRRCGGRLRSAEHFRDSGKFIHIHPGFHHSRSSESVLISLTDVWSLRSDVTQELTRDVLSGRRPSWVQAVGGSSALTVQRSPVTSARDNGVKSRAAGPI